jgi:hypothetical protein
MASQLSSQVGNRIFAPNVLFLEEQNDRESPSMLGASLRYLNLPHLLAASLDGSALEKRRDTSQ